jgi:hypothetical protein
MERRRGNDHNYQNTTISMKAKGTTIYSPNESVDRKQRFSVAGNFDSTLIDLKRLTIYFGRYIRNFG